MEHPVLRLDAVRASDRGFAGGKAANLGELIAHGFPVPPGYVVGAPACREFFETIGLPAAAAGLAGVAGAELAQRCAGLRRMIVEAETPAALAAAILDEHDALFGEDTGVACAVRSSATAEDSAALSFAGQHGTYYYVQREQLLERIRHCWASLWSLEAAAYRAAQSVPHAGVFMAVVVQEMVLSEVSGVAFTANPMTGARDEIVVEASWGMGAAIVDGRVTPDRYVVGHDRLQLRERRIAEKRFMVAAELPRHGERLVPVATELRGRQALSTEQLQDVVKWARRCEARFAAPQDVEWAIAGGLVHVLQSRPITALKEPEPRDPSGQYVLFKPLAENFTDPIPPLSADLLFGAIPPGFRLIRGRPYVDLAHVRPWLPLEIADEDLASAVYLSAGRTGAPLRVSWRRLPVAALLGGLAALSLAVTFARTRSLPDSFMDSYRERCRRARADPGLGPAEALARLWFPAGPLLPIGHFVILVNGTSLRLLPWLAILRTLVRRWAPDAAADAVARLCAGEAGVLSAEMGRSLWALGVTARRSARVAELILGNPPSEAVSRLRAEPEAAAFVAELDAFLAVHGHRALKEFDLRSPRWHEDAAPVLGMIRSYLATDDGLGERAHDTAARARAEAEEALRLQLEARPFGRLRLALIRHAAARTRYFLKLRENSRFHHIMALDVVRRKLLAIEEELLRAQRLKCRDDVFFLRLAELRELRSGTLDWLDVEEPIRQRRLADARLSRSEPPRTIGIASQPAPEEDAQTLRGQGASPGRFEGVARKVVDPAVDIGLRPGEVLIAPYTDPAWTPLFLSAGAAVVEVGSYLSHAGTIAREFGMPCVVDVADCMRRIPAGARVEVDGSRGTVRLLGGAEGPG